MTSHQKISKSLSCKDPGLRIWTLSSRFSQITDAEAHIVLEQRSDDPITERNRPIAKKLSQNHSELQINHFRILFWVQYLNFMVISIVCTDAPKYRTTFCNGCLGIGTILGERLRGNRTRGNRTESRLREEIFLGEGLREDLRKPPRGTKATKTKSQQGTSRRFRRSSRRPSRRRFSSRRLSVLLPLIVSPLTLGPHPQYGWDFPEEIPEEFRKDPGNALRAFPGIPVESTAGIPQTL